MTGEARPWLTATGAGVFPAVVLAAIEFGLDDTPDWLFAILLSLMLTLTWGLQGPGPAPPASGLGETPATGSATLWAGRPGARLVLAARRRPERDDPMDAIIVLAVIIGILVGLFVPDWRLNRNRPRPWRRNAPPTDAEVYRAQHPHQTSHWSGMGGGDGSSFSG
jgi:hypothetical protein